MNIQFQNMPKHVVVYARVSTDEQADRGTIEAQLDFAKKYCDLHGITIMKIYKDDGITGTIPLQSRPMGAELLADARRKLFSTVLVYKLDRLGRSTRVILNAVHDLEESDIKLKSMTEPFDTSDPSGRFLLTILAGVADLERSNILERMWLGANRAASQGKWLGGIVPYGYVMTKDKFLKINDEPLPNMNISEADVIRLIYKLCGEEGKTTLEIAEHLTALHVPTAYVAHGITGKRHKQVSGNWLAGRVRNMIVEPIYKGIHYYGRRANRKRELIERKFPAIISEELWDKAQKTLKRNQLDSFRNAKHFYLLRGLIRCKNCGLTYRGSPSGNGENNKYSYYICGGKHHRNALAREKCIGMAIRMEWLDDWIWGKCLDYINNPDLVRTAILANQENPDKKVDAELELIQQQLEQETIEKDRLIRLYTTGLIEIDEVSTQLDKIKHNRATLEKRKEELSQKKNEIFSAVESAEEILSLLRKKINSDELTPELKRNIIRILVDRIEVFTSEYKKMEITAYFKFKESSSTNYEKETISRTRKTKPSMKRESTDTVFLRCSTKGHGFIAAIRIMLEGKVSVAWTLETVIFRSSIGSRSTSSVDFPNSGSSSRKRTP